MSVAMIDVVEAEVKRRAIEPWCRAKRSGARRCASKREIVSGEVHDERDDRCGRRRRRGRALSERSGARRCVCQCVSVRETVSEVAHDERDERRGRGRRRGRMRGGARRRVRR